MKSPLTICLLLLCSAVQLCSCHKIDFLPHHQNHNNNLDIYKGTPVDLSNGKASSWLTVSHLGAPVELGLELSRESLYGLPDTNFFTTVPLPVQAKELTPFDHIFIEWSSHGHPFPAAEDTSFISPHYDIRFFMTTLEEHLSIPAPTDPSGKFDVFPSAGYMPANYFPFGYLAKQGKTWTDKSGFLGMRKAMVLGTYNGKFTFVSPIVIIEELRSGNSSSTLYGQPKNFQKHQIYYPTKYNIYADDSNQKHQVTLSNFVLR